MTTAHRATWKAARGGIQEEGSFRLHVPSAAVSSKDAPTERTLKLRQDAHPASREALRAALESDEHSSLKDSPAPKRARFHLPAAPMILPGLADNKDGGTRLDVDQLDKDVELGNDEEEDEGGKAGEKGDGDDESDEESEEDDEAELLAELERIRKEREFERAKRQAEEQERLEREATERAASGNPLLPNLNMFNDEISDTVSIATGSVPAFAVKRRWDDDVIFRNQAKGEQKLERRFINDTIRNDFHRRFMKRYMR